MLTDMKLKTTNESSDVILTPRIIGIDWYRLYITVLVLISFVGVVGNLLVIGAILINIRLRKLSSALIVNLAISDLLVTGIAVPFAIVGVVNREFLYRHTALCDALGSLSVTACCCSIWTIAAISVDRYVHICHPKTAIRLCSRQQAPFLLAGTWTLGFAVDMPNFLGWGAHRFDAIGLNCSYHILRFEYTIYICTLGAIVPMLIIANCYIRIYRAVKKSNRRLKGHKHGLYDTRCQEMQTFKAICTILVVFSITWTPYLLYSLFGQFYGTWPRWLLMTSNALGISNSSLNCLIYGLMNKQFRDGYVMCLRKFFVWDSTQKHGASLHKGYSIYFFINCVD